MSKRSTAAVQGPGNDSSWHAVWGLTSHRFMLRALCQSLPALPNPFMHSLGHIYFFKWIVLQGIINLPIIRHQLSGFKISSPWQRYLWVSCLSLLALLLMTFQTVSAVAVEVLLLVPADEPLSPLRRAHTENLGVLTEFLRPSEARGWKFLGLAFTSSETRTSRVLPLSLSFHFPGICCTGVVMRSNHATKMHS